MNKNCKCVTVSEGCPLHDTLINRLIHELSSVDTCFDDTRMPYPPVLNIGEWREVRDALMILDKPHGWLTKTGREILAQGDCTTIRPHDQPHGTPVERRIPVFIGEPEDD